MQYLLMIYSAQNAGPQPGDEDFAEFMGEYFAFTRETQDRQAFVAGDALEDVDTATTVRVREGKVDITDGPFAETKEVLGGYYLLECQNLDEAIEWACKIPSARFGSVEIRPIMTLPAE
ncbi:MAG: YciI family protein [Pseudomonadota bacterium]